LPPSDSPQLASTLPARPDRLLQAALFVTSVAWILCSQTVAAHAAQGIALRFDLLPERPFLAALFFLFLLGLGFSMLQAIFQRQGALRDVLGLPSRPTAPSEWALGAAIGWGSMVLAVLPMALAGSLHISFWTAPRSLWLLLVNLATFAAAALAEEVAFRGFPYRRLIAAIGPVAATIVMSVFFGLLHALNPSATMASVLITMFAGLLLSVAWLRTHGLWLPWGLHFAWNASMGLVFGLPVSGITTFSTVVQTRAIGPLWLTGGDYGPEGALLTIFVLLIAIAVLVRLTRDYAWEYTHPPIVAAGYPMDAPPPAAHVAMEKAALERAATEPQASPGSLVQILPVAPQSRPANDEPKL
jgi:membrane protease YdiL (CAAX protease family)